MSDLILNHVVNNQIKATFDLHIVKISFCGMLGSNHLKVQETQIAEFANSVDLDEVAHYEPPHLDLHCLPSSL